ncbi:MAG: hypothetical protein LQ351_005253 [Letrouitia transgressa]|nr:MAG: hypothetical protein LQ351_005253 [Letrouitia transgressa]
MSALYNLEPQPTAKVLLETTSGDILLELFAKQTPLASRNFLQLCLNGYYTNTIFHRLVPGFVIQGGDPSGTGEGGEASYESGAFDDEFHSRLKFNRRGLLGMANTGQKNDNGSQFFLTLGATPELQGENTMFGRVVGDTIYNVMKMSEAELAGDGGERPLYPTKITGTEILVNPFQDMVKTVDVARSDDRGALDKKDAKKRPKKTAGKALLSFGEEGEESEIAPSLPKEKFNKRLVVSDDSRYKSTSRPTDRGREVNGRKDGTAKPAETVPSKATRKDARRIGSRSPPPGVDQQRSTLAQLPLPNEEEPSRSPPSSPEPAEVGKMSSLLDRTNAQIAELKASMKRNLPLAPESKSQKKSALEQMIPATATRGRKRKHGVNSDSSKDVRTVEMLRAFQEKLENAPQEVEKPSTTAVTNGEKQAERDGFETGQPKEENEETLCDLHFIANCQSCQSWENQASADLDAADVNDQSWMSHSLNFEKDRLGKDLTWKKKNEEELVVIDPREKAKGIKEEQRAKRMKGGGGARAWDRDRDRDHDRRR